MAITIFNRKNRTVSAIPNTAPMDALEFEQKKLELTKAALDDAAAMRNAASTYTTGSITGSAFGATYFTPASSIPTGSPSLTWGPTIFEDATFVSMKEFQQLQQHVIELAELVASLQDEIIHLKARRAA